MKFNSGLTISLLAASATAAVLPNNYVIKTETFRRDGIPCNQAPGLKTEFFMGDTGVNFGTVKPVDMVRDLKQACHDVGCDPSNVMTRDTRQELFSSKVKVSASSANAPNGDVMNAMLDALSIMVENSQKNTPVRLPVHCHGGQNTDGCDPGDAPMVDNWTFHDYFKVTVHDGCNEVAHLEVKAWNEKSKSQEFFCKAAIEAVGKGLAGPLAPLGNIFGKASVVCNGVDSFKIN